MSTCTWTSIRKFSDFCGILEIALRGLWSGLKENSLILLNEGASDVCLQTALLDAGYALAKSSSSNPQKFCDVYSRRFSRGDHIVSEEKEKLERSSKSNHDVWALSYDQDEYLMIMELKVYPGFGPKAQLNSTCFEKDLKHVIEGHCHVFVFASSSRLYESRQNKYPDLLPDLDEVPKNQFKSFSTSTEDDNREIVEMITRITRVSMTREITRITRVRMTRQEEVFVVAIYRRPYKLD